MKPFASIVKYIVIPVSSVIGIIYGFDMYVIERAKTVVEPTKAELSALIKTVDKIDNRTIRIENILLERASKTKNK